MKRNVMSFFNALIMCLCLSVTYVHSCVYSCPSRSTFPFHSTNSTSCAQRTVRALMESVQTFVHIPRNLTLNCCWCSSSTQYNKVRSGLRNISSLNNIHVSNIPMNVFNESYNRTSSEILNKYNFTCSSLTYCYISLEIFKQVITNNAVFESIEEFCSKCNSVLIYKSNKAIYWFIFKAFKCLSFMAYFTSTLNVFKTYKLKSMQIKWANNSKERKNACVLSLKRNNSFTDKINVNDGKAIFRHTNNAYSNVMYTVYPSSSLHLLASYRPLLYIERPDSLFFSKLSSSGFFYPGRGVSVTCVSCDNSVELIRFVSEPSSAIYHTPGCEYIKEDNDDVSSNTALSQSDASRPFCLPQDATNGVHGNTVPSLSSNSQAPELSLPASSSQAPELSLPASSSQAPELSLPASSSQAPELSLPASSSHTNCHRNGENQNISSVANLLSTANPAYPVYSESSKRFQSFVNWPNSHDQSSTALVNAGFFYAGYSDCVRCFYCGLGLRSWKPGDDIFVEHERYRPTCLYLQTLSKNKTRDTVSRCIVENDTTNINSELERVSSVPSSTETMQQPTTTNLQRSADNRRHLSRNDETQVQVTQHSVTNEVTQVEVTQHEVTNEVTKALENSLTSASEIRNLQNVTKTLLQRENQALKQLMKCKACNVAPIQDLFLPCGEMYTCKDCSNKFTHCPSCGKRILGTVTVFFS